MSEKLCVFCKECRISTDGYDTSGYYGVIECEKGHWGPLSYIPGRSTLMKAEKCPDYDEAHIDR